MIPGLIAVGFLVVVNIAAVAYSYGKLTQRVDNLCSRITRVENLVNSDLPKRRETKHGK